MRYRRRARWIRPPVRQAQTQQMQTELDGWLAGAQELAQQAGSAAQEAMSAVSDKPAPGIASAVIRGKTLIAADPEEHMDALMDSAPQVMESLRSGR